MQVHSSLVRGIRDVMSVSSPVTHGLSTELARRTENVRHMPSLTQAAIAHILELREAATKPAKDPKVKDDSVGYQSVDGELYGSRGPSVRDVRQGGLGDCYFLASLASVVAEDPDAIRDAIKDNGDGTYSVRFYKSNGSEVWITVDADLPVDKNGKLAYARAGDSDKDGKLELWVPLFEKAYAAFKDKYGPDDGVHGYKDLARGGSSSDALEALTGKNSRYITTPKSDSSLLDLLQAADDGAHVVLSTRNDANEGWVGRHAYTVLGTFEKDGEQWVRVRNPWGSTEPDAALDDGKNDGIFDIPLSELRDQIKGVHTDEPRKVSLFDFLQRLFG